MLLEHASMSASNYQRYPLGGEALDLGVRVLGRHRGRKPRTLAGSPCITRTRVPSWRSGA